MYLCCTIWSIAFSCLNSCLNVSTIQMINGEKRESMFKLSVSRYFMVSAHGNFLYDRHWHLIAALPVPSIEHRAIHRIIALCGHILMFCFYI